jgi:hypothetical protein
MPALEAHASLMKNRLKAKFMPEERTPVFHSP